MKHIVVFIALAGLALMLQGIDSASQTTVPRGETRNRDINAFGGTVIIEGTLDASVFMIGGKLILSGEVKEDVICLGTEVDMRESGIIGKDLWVISNRLQRAEKSVVGGRVVQVKSLEDLRKMAATILPFIPDERDLSIYKILKITFWFILCLIILGIFPDKVIHAVKNPDLRLLRLGTRGLLLYLLFLFLMVIFAFLSLFLIGLPLLLVLFISYFIALAFGRTAIFYLLGNTVSRGLRAKKLNPTLYLLIGIIPYAVCKFIPIAGMVLIIIMDFFAIGISASILLKKRTAA